MVNRRLGWLLTVALLVMVGGSLAFAQEAQLGGKIRSGDQVVVPADETVDGDLYASGGQVRIDGTVAGDLVASGGQVEVGGQVTGDVMAAGGSVNISGQIDGDVRAAGGQLAISGSVDEDLFVAGGQVTLAGSGRVGEDLVMGTGQMTLDGTVEGDVLGVAGNYTRRGTVAGSETVTVGEEPARPLADRSLDALQRLVSVLVIAAIVMWLAPRLIVEPAESLRRRPMASLGVGILGMVGIVALVLAVILVAVLVAVGVGLVGLGDLVATVIVALIVTLGVIALAVFLALAFGAPAVVGMSLAGLAVGPDSTTQRWAALILGLVVVVALTAIPVVGGWLAFIVTVFGLGALILGLRRSRTPVVEQPAE